MTSNKTVSRVLLVLLLVFGCGGLVLARGQQASDAAL